MWLWRGPTVSAAIWRLRQVLRRTSVRASFFAALAAVTAVAAIYLKRYIPEEWNDLVGASATESLLAVLASSLLSVTTFTLGAMVNSYNAAAAATPRATPLIVADTTSQNVLSIFVGAFVFAIVGLVLLRTGVYGGSGRVVLLAATILVLATVVLALLRWISRISRLGLLTDSIDLVEAAARSTLKTRIEHPHFGACPPLDEIGPGLPVWPGEIGYVQHVDMSAIQKLADEHDFVVHLKAPPGAFVAPSLPLAVVVGPAGKDELKQVVEAFQIGIARDFEYDARFGFLVLSEIASKALSPGINDPGTALDIVVRATRLLEMWANREPSKRDAPAYPRIHAPELSSGDLFDDAFDAIERDGAGLVEVALRVQAALAILANGRDPESSAAARRHSRRGLERARAALGHADDYVRVESAAIAGDTDHP